MSRTISKRKIKNYIRICEEELEEIREEVRYKVKENEKTNIGLYELTDLYEKEAEIKGNIRASRYILNNCLNK